MDRIKVAGIIKESVVDGPGIRLVVFAQGVSTIVQAVIIPKHTPLMGAKILRFAKYLKR